MARLNRWHNWLVIDRMVPTGQHTDEAGRKWGDFDATMHRRWFWVIHPGYWRTRLSKGL